MIVITAVQSCSKKSYPSGTEVNDEIKGKTSTVVPAENIIRKNDSAVVIKPVTKRKVAESIPKVIVVNDKYANKSVDGRLYYDLQGHRYWRNNKDGKYYLFNKSMQTDNAFKNLK